MGSHFVSQIRRCSYWMWIWPFLGPLEFTHKQKGIFVDASWNVEMHMLHPRQDSGAQPAVRRHCICSLVTLCFSIYVGLWWTNAHQTQYNWWLSYNITYHHHCPNAPLDVFTKLLGGCYGQTSHWQYSAPALDSLQRTCQWRAEVFNWIPPPWLEHARASTQNHPTCK